MSERWDAATKAAVQVIDSYLMAYGYARLTTVLKREMARDMLKAAARAYAATPLSIEELGNREIGAPTPGNFEVGKRQYLDKPRRNN